MSSFSAAAVLADAVSLSGFASPHLLGPSSEETWTGMQKPGPDLSGSVYVVWGLKAHIKLDIMLTMSLL